MATKKLPRMRPQDLRAIVRGSMARQGISTHELAARLEGIVNRATIYNWLSGTTASIGSDKLGHVFAALYLIVNQINTED